MPWFCGCGADEYLCQVCGQVRCSKEQPGSWVDGVGNVCDSCGNNMKLQEDEHATQSQLGE
jgi:hypothetical protein